MTPSYICNWVQTHSPLYPWHTSHPLPTTRPPLCLDSSPNTPNHPPTPHTLLPQQPALSLGSVPTPPPASGRYRSPTAAALLNTDPPHAGPQLYRRSLPQATPSASPHAARAGGARRERAAFPDWLPRPERCRRGPKYSGGPSGRSRSWPGFPASAFTGACPVPLPR